MQVSKLKLKEGSQRMDDDELEVIDLAESYETPYSRLAPRDYQKLHKLHTSVQEDRPLRMMHQTPVFEYGSGKSPTLPFAPINDGDFDDDGGFDDSEFPSPSELLRKNVHSSSNSLSPALLQRKVGSNLELPSPATLQEQYDNGDPFEEGYVAYQLQASESHTHDDSLASPEAPMLDFSDSMILAPRQASPKLSSSFADGVFDFASFPEETHDTKGNPGFSAYQVMNPEPPVLLQTTPASLKRERSPTPEQAEVKHRRVVKDEIPQSPTLPAWVSEFDSELIDGLKDFVDFVD